MHANNLSMFYPHHIYFWTHKYKYQCHSNCSNLQIHHATAPSEFKPNLQRAVILLFVVICYRGLSTLHILIDRAMGLHYWKKSRVYSITKLLLNDMSNMKVRLCSYMSAPIPLGKQRTDIHLDSIIRTNYSNPHECYMSACNFRSNKIQLILSKIFAIESSNYYMMIKFFGSI